MFSIKSATQMVTLKMTENVVFVMVIVGCHAFIMPACSGAGYIYTMLLYSADRVSTNIMLGDL